MSKYGKLAVKRWPIIAPKRQQCELVRHQRAGSHVNVSASACGITWGLMIWACWGGSVPAAVGTEPDRKDLRHGGQPEARNAEQQSPKHCFPLLSLCAGPARSGARRSLGTRLAAGAAKRRRCSTTWLTSCLYPTASAPTWTRPPSWGWPSASCAHASCSPRVGTRNMHVRSAWLSAEGHLLDRFFALLPLVLLKIRSWGSL